METVVASREATQNFWSSLAGMATANEPQRMLFTFRRNGDSNGKRLVEITVEPLEQHEAPAESKKLKWFGAEDDVAAALEGLGFPTHDLEGVLGALHTNRDATREFDVPPSRLDDTGFRASV